MHQGMQLAKIPQVRIFSDYAKMLKIIIVPNFLQSWKLSKIAEVSECGCSRKSSEVSKLHKLAEVRKL